MAWSLPLPTAPTQGKQTLMPAGRPSAESAPVKNGADTAISAFDAQKGKGRPKGALNKTTILAKAAIAQAAEKLGGVERIVEWVGESPENEKVFWSSMYTKLIPVQTEVSGKDGEA